MENINLRRKSKIKFKILVILKFHRFLYGLLSIRGLTLCITNCRYIPNRFSRRRGLCSELVNRPAKHVLSIR